MELDEPIPPTQVGLRQLHREVPLIAATSLTQPGRRRLVLTSTPDTWTLHRLGDGPYAFLTQEEAEQAFPGLVSDQLASHLPNWHMQFGTRAHDMGGIARVRLTLGRLGHLRQTVVIGPNLDRNPRGNAVLHASGGPISDSAWRATTPTTDLGTLLHQITSAIQAAEQRYLAALQPDPC